MHKPINREWPYCDEFEFFKHKKILRAKNALSIRNISFDLSPLYENGQMMDLNFHEAYRPDALKKYSACCYWDGEKINIALFLKKKDDQIQLIKLFPKMGLFTISEKYLLCRLPDLQLSWWQKLKLLCSLKVQKSLTTHAPYSLDS